MRSQEPILSMMKMVPQVQRINPALYNDSLNYISLPGISNFNFELEAQGLKLNDVSNSLYDNDDAAAIWDDLAESLSSNNSIAFNAKTTILGLGIKIKNGFFSFEAIHRTSGQIQFSNSFADLRYIQSDFVIPSGEINSQPELEIDALSYNEYKFGYAHQITPKLRVGASFKFLSGISYVDSEDMGIDIQYNEETGGLIQTKGQLAISGPFDYSHNNNHSVNDISFKNNLSVNDLLITNNTGLAFDFGANYDITDKLNINVAITEIGSIKWKSYNLYESNQTFVLDQNTVLQGTNMGSFMADSLSKALELKVENTSKKQKLNTTLNTNINYQLLKWLKLGVNYSSTSVYDDRHNQMTFMADFSRKEFSAFIIGYSISNINGNSLNLGTSARLLKVIQFYAFADKMENMFKDSSEVSSLSIRGGINVVF